ncbi:DUF2631 domain-containing protein [Cumulibacter manganitolerans]|uniref:DUF2631 domain-containing protein n=1 Tax=Cumulibacter manganitolerans TaxID=1884992 RepID=UPI001885D53F|nr:DUF2631 domain-containing protein [Cumulibacter manganitolerans]
MARTSTDHELVHHGTAHPARTRAAVQLADDDPRIWGWHHEGNGSTSRKAGIVVALILLAMLFGNHRGKVEDLWLVAVAGILVLMLLVSIGNRRKSTWRK